MFSFTRSSRAKKALAAAVAATLMLTVAGWAKKQQQQGGQAGLVKTMILPSYMITLVLLKLPKKQS